MSRTFRRLDGSIDFTERLVKNYTDESIRDFICIIKHSRNKNQSLEKLIAKHFYYIHTDSSKGWNAPKSFRQESEKTFRSRFKQTLSKELKTEKEQSYPVFKHDVNYHYF